MTTTFRTHFTFRVDTWTPDGESIVEHVAGVEDYQVALATFLAACQRWPGTPITLRQGARVIEDSRRLRVVGYRCPRFDCAEGTPAPFHWCQVHVSQRV
jgi:hypothetical protein